MIKEQVKINWLENMAFKAEVNGHEVILDASEKARW